VADDPLLRHEPTHLQQWDAELTRTLRNTVIALVLVVVLIFVLVAIVAWGGPDEAEPDTPPAVIVG
jgi:hypothetical protein